MHPALGSYSYTALVIKFIMLSATSQFLAFFFTASVIFTGAIAAPAASYTNWKTFKGNGVNLGGWLAQEAVIDPSFWSQSCVNTPDEWTCCIKLGSQCGPILERRYATFITVRDIDRLAAGGVKVLRIPTTYAAWVKVRSLETQIRIETA